MTRDQTCRTYFTQILMGSVELATNYIGGTALITTTRKGPRPQIEQLPQNATTAIKPRSGEDTRLGGAEQWDNAGRAATASTPSRRSTARKKADKASYSNEHEGALSSEAPGDRALRSAYRHRNERPGQRSLPASRGAAHAGTSSTGLFNIPRRATAPAAGRRPLSAGRHPRAPGGVDEASDGVARSSGGSESRVCVKLTGSREAGAQVA